MKKYLLIKIPHQRIESNFLHEANENNRFFPTSNTTYIQKSFIILYTYIGIPTLFSNDAALSKNSFRL